MVFKIDGEVYDVIKHPNPPPEQWNKYLKRRKVYQIDPEFVIKHRNPQNKTSNILCEWEDIDTKKIFYTINGDKINV